MQLPPPPHETPVAFATFIMQLVQLAPQSVVLCVASQPFARFVSQSRNVALQVV